MSIQQRWRSSRARLGGLDIQVLRDGRETMAERTIGSLRQMGEGMFTALVIGEPAVDSHRSIIYGRGFTAGQRVPLLSDHNWQGNIYGEGELRVEGDEVWLDGVRGDTPEAKTFWAEVDLALEMGRNVEVSVGMDWMTWQFRTEADLTEQERQMRNIAGEHALYAIDAVPRTLEVSRVVAGSVPDTTLRGREDQVEPSAVLLSGASADVMRPLRMRGT